MILGCLKQFEQDLPQIKEKAQLNKKSPKTLRQRNHNSTHQPRNDQTRDDSEEISLLHGVITDM